TARSGAIGLSPRGIASPAPPARRSLPCHTKTARASCAATKRMPVAIIVSPSPRSIPMPWTEMSAGGHHTCSAKIVADMAAITTTIIAKSFPTSVRQRFEDEVDRDCPACWHRYLLALSPELFMPGGDGVRAWREAGECERAVVLADGVMRGGEHDEVAVHPRMHITLDG